MLFYDKIYVYIQSQILFFFIAEIKNITFFKLLTSIHVLYDFEIKLIIKNNLEKIYIYYYYQRSLRDFDFNVLQSQVLNRHVTPP